MRCLFNRGNCRRRSSAILPMTNSLPARSRPIAGSSSAETSGCSRRPVTGEWKFSDPGALWSGTSSVRLEELWECRLFWLRRSRFRGRLRNPAETDLESVCAVGPGRGVEKGRGAGRRQSLQAAPAGYTRSTIASWVVALRLKSSRPGIGGPKLGSFRGGRSGRQHRREGYCLQDG